MKIKKTYFELLFDYNKCLFILVLIFIVGQIFFSYKGVETTPFFNYGMYSAPISPPAYYTRIELKKENQSIPLSDLGYLSTDFLAYQLNYYQELKNRVGLDLMDPTQFTIEKRFGKNSTITNYLTPLLTNSSADVNTFLPWLIDYTAVEGLSIEPQKYQLKNQFEPYED